MTFHVTADLILIFFEYFIQIDEKMIISNVLESSLKPVRKVKTLNAEVVMIDYLASCVDEIMDKVYADRSLKYDDLEGLFTEIEKVFEDPLSIRLYDIETFQCDAYNKLMEEIDKYPDECLIAFMDEMCDLLDKLKYGLCYENE